MEKETLMRTGFIEMKEILKEAVASMLKSMFHNKSNLTYLIIFLSIIIFKKPIEETIQDKLFNELFSRIELGDFAEGFLVFTFILIITFYVWAIIRLYRLSSFYNVTFSLVALFVFYYRFFDPSVFSFGTFHTKTFNWFDGFYCIDLIWLAYIPHLILNGLIRIEDLCIDSNWKRNTSVFLIDEESGLNGDSLGREDMAKKIADEIYKLYSKNSFAIGIIGEWGAGKSFFMNMVVKRLEQEDGIILMHFNPWRFKNADLIAEGFFNMLKVNLAPYNADISSQIDRYYDKLSILDSTSISKAIKSLFVVNTEIEHDFLQVNDIIAKLNHKVVIVIDDFDRLDGREIFQVLRIIRNTGNFVNTVFLAAYDKSYVIKAIEKDLNQHNAEYFLEKIFQIEYNLPIIKDSRLKDSLIQNVLKILELPKSKQELKLLFEDNTPDNLFNVLPSDLQYDYKYVNTGNIILKYIENIRDITRLSNYLFLNLGYVEGDVNIGDYILLELIRMTSPQTYSNIRKKYNITIKNSEILEKSIYTCDLSKYKAQFEKEGMEASKAELLSETIEYLFIDGNDRSDSRSLCSVISFPLYFNYNIGTKIPHKVFIRSRRSNYQVFWSAIVKWIDEGKLNEVIELINQIDTYDNRADFEKVFRVALRLHSENKIYNFPQLLNKISPATYKEQLRQFYKDDVDFSDSIILIIGEQPRHDLVIVNLVGQMLLGHARNEPSLVSKASLEGMALLSLETVISKATSTKDDMDVISAVHSNCIKEISQPKNEIKILESANKMMRSFIDKNPKLYLGSVLRSFDIYNETFVIDPFVPEIFGDYNQFATFLQTQPKDNEVLEVITFFRKFKANNYKPTEFKRKTIEFVSDKSVVFEGSPSYPTLETSNCEETTVHPWYQTIVGLYPEFIGANFVAHKSVITRAEEVTGGVYNLRYVFEYSPTSLESVKSVELHLFVDDECDIILNEKLIAARVNTGAATVFIKDIKGELSFNTPNLLKFVITNVSNPSLAQDRRTDQFGKLNPYGVIFRIAITYEE